MGFVKEFREFAIKGNVFDMAIGVIMGGAFGKIVTSLIDNLISPIMGLAGGVNFTNMYFMLTHSDKYVPGADYTVAKGQGAALGYGAFITDVINFMIMAFVVFLMVKAFNTARKRFEAQQPAPAPAGPTEKDYLRQIAESLAKR